MVVVSYGGLPLDDSLTYYIYIADLETIGSMIYSNSYWALCGDLGVYFTFQSTRGGKAQSTFAFKVVHLGAGRFKLIGNTRVGDREVRSAQKIPIDVGASIYNNAKNADYLKEGAPQICIDDFDCPGTKICSQGTCNYRELPGEYLVNSGKRYGKINDDPEHPTNWFFESSTRACKWTNCLSSSRCDNSVELQPPGIKMPGNDGWEPSGLTCRDTNGQFQSCPYYCALPHESHTLCCPKNAVARVNYTFIGFSGDVARFGAMAAGSVGGLTAAVLKVVDLPATDLATDLATDVAFCGVTDYLNKALKTDIIGYTPMLMPMKMTPARVFDAYADPTGGEARDGRDTRSRETKFRVVFGTQFFTYG
jgi:hypothetical protein